MKVSKFCFLSFLLPLICFSQTLTGNIIDKVTQQPIETVSVYFDNTTIGTTTDEKGNFSITYTDAVQSTLVISYLGYEKVLITDYRSRNNIAIELVEAASALDEVYIEYDDGLTRRQKLRLFRREFLGSSKFARSCNILNENDIVLRYDKRSKTLFASADVPIQVKNKSLQYELAFDIVDFEANYRYANLETQDFTLNKVTYAGTSFYKDIEISNKKSTKRRREKAYKGSVQHFMRSLYNENLKDEDYEIFYKGFKVNEWAYFNIKTNEESSFKGVSLKAKVSILYDKKFQSDIEVNVDSFLIDAYGNYTNVRGILFNGTMGSQRIGDTLPLDYGL